MVRQSRRRIENEKTVEMNKKGDSRQSLQQKKGKRVSGEGLPGGKTGEVDDRREKYRDINKTVKQYDHMMTDGRRQNVQQENGKHDDRWEEADCAAREW